MDRNKMRYISKRFVSLSIAGIALTLYSDTASAQHSQAVGAVPISWHTQGSASIESSFGGSKVTVTVTKRLAGAIHSVRWKNKEFINSYGHGRQLQSAVHFNGWGECYMPTEAGSMADGTGETSSSQLLSLQLSGATLITKTNMAFWVPPGSAGQECLGYNGPRIVTPLSGHVLTKKVTIGAEGLMNAIDHVVTFSVASSFQTAMFEVLGAYMPPEFSEFWRFDPGTGTRSRLSDGPGGQNLPIIFSTPDQRYAFGVYSEGLPQLEYPRVGYARWRFADLVGPGNATVKWNCVFRERDVKLGNYTYRCTSIFGTLRDVEQAMMELHRKRGRKLASPR